MTSKTTRTISEWRPIAELRRIDTNISEYGYSREYIAANQLDKKKSYHVSNNITGRVNFFEPLEVKGENGIVLYRENDTHTHMEEPRVFHTQFGTFNNHNNGEFPSWIGKDDSAGLFARDIDEHRFYDREDFSIPGNFCDMFDCGEYSYAISNLMHMGLGTFSIVRIGKDYTHTVLYTTESGHGWTCLEYAGHFQNEHGQVVIASGFTEQERGQENKRVFKNRTILFQIDYQGNCSAKNEWETVISSANSYVVHGNIAYFGQNKMVTQLNLETGELSFYTNKTDEELAALDKMR